MKKKNVSTKHPAKKAHSPSRSGGVKSNVEQKKSTNSLQSPRKEFQSGFSEPSRNVNIDYDTDTIGIP